MILRIFRSNYPLQFVLIFVLGLLFWIPGFVSLQQMPLKQGFAPLYELVFNLLGSQKLLSAILALVFVFVQGFLLNHIFSKNNLQNRTTLFAGFLYIVIMSSDLSSLTLTPILFANFFMILALDKLFDYSNNHSKAQVKIYTASLYVAIASLFYFPFIAFWVFILLSLIVLKAYKWREWCISLLGLLAPFLAVFTYSFLVDTFFKNLTEIYLELTQPMAIISFSRVSFIDIFFLGLVVLFSFASFYILFRDLSGKEIAIRYKSYLSIFYILIAFIPFFYQGFLPQGSLVFAIPLSFLLSNFFVHVKFKPLVCEILLLLLLITTFLKVLLDSF